MKCLFVCLYFTYPNKLSINFFNCLKSLDNHGAKNPKTCLEKESVLIDDFNQVINLTEYSREYKATTASGCKIDLYRNESWYYCVHHRTFQSYRERWWFIALDNCNSKEGLYLKYKITMTNSQTNSWLKHFSADEFCKNAKFNF